MKWNGMEWMDEKNLDDLLLVFLSRVYVYLASVVCYGCSSLRDERECRRVGKQRHGSDIGSGCSVFTPQRRLQVEYG